MMIKHVRKTSFGFIYLEVNSQKISYFDFNIDKSQQVLWSEIMKTSFSESLKAP